MTSPIRHFAHTILLAALSLTLFALAAGTPAWAQVEDDPFALPAEPTAPPADGAIEPAEPLNPALEDETPATTGGAAFEPREPEYVQHESGIPYMSPDVDVTPEEAAAFQRAKELLAEKNYAEALEVVQSIRQFPGVIELRARILAGLGRTQLALAAMDQVIKYMRTNTQQGTPWTMLETRGDIYADESLFDQAISDYTAAAELVLQDALLQSKLGMTQVRFGMDLRGTNPQASAEEMSQGIGALERAVELGLDNAEIQLHMGIARSELRDIPGAIENYEAAVAFDPEEPFYHQLLGTTYMRLASQKEAADPDDKAAIIEDYELALEHFDVSLELDPGDFDEETSDDQAAEDDLGLDLGDEATPEAVEDEPYFESYEPALIYGARADAHISMGDMLTDQAARDEQYRLAIQDSDLALKLNDQQPEAWYHKGVALRMLGELEPAIQAFTEALKLAPEFQEAQLRRGIAWYYLGEHDLAVMDFDDVNKYDIDPRASFWKGLSQATRGDHYQAVQSYTDVLRSAPDHGMAHVNRGLAYLNLGEHQRALTDFNEVIRQDPTNADAYYYRGQTQEAMGDSEGAVGSYQQSVNWNPQQEAASYRLNSLNGL